MYSIIFSHYTNLRLKMDKLSTKARGDLAEDKAYMFLLKNSFEVFERNFYTNLGEIDLIAIKDGVLHFVEVKSSISYESAINNINKKKISRVTASAYIYMKEKNLDLPFCLDAIIITNNSIEFIENLTL